MKKFLLLMIIAFLFVGCRPAAKETSFLIDVAHRATINSDRIDDAYHLAMMETFDQISLARIEKAKSNIDRLGAENKLTPKIVKEGFDRLRESLARIEARRTQFIKLHESSGQNNANSREALEKANDLVARSAKIQLKLDGLIDDVMKKVGGKDNE